jgi:hypothetical protein
MSQPERPEYVDHGGQQVFCQPLELHGVRFYSFLLEADGQALRDLCDQRLNRPSLGHVEYHPLVPRVLLGVADIGKAFCVNPPDSEKGWMREVDVAFWVPVAAVQPGAVLTQVERVAWFLPYVFVDGGIAAASGREIYGFPKALGQFRVPDGPGGPVRVTVDTHVVEHYGPGAGEVTPRRLLEVQPAADAGEGGLGRVWDDLLEAFTEFRGLVFGPDGSVTLPGLGLVVQVFKFLLHKEVPLVFLKQFRDVADGRRACYQAIVEAPAQVLQFRTAGELKGAYRVVLHNFDSCPIARDLGLTAEGQPALAAWYTDFDFVMGNGREVWRAPA